MAPQSLATPLRTGIDSQTRNSQQTEHKQTQNNATQSKFPELVKFAVRVIGRERQ